MGTTPFISIFQQRLPVVRAAETDLDLVLDRPVPCAIDHRPEVVHLRQRPTETKRNVSVQSTKNLSLSRIQFVVVHNSLPSSPESKDQEYRTVQYLRPKIAKPDQQKQTASQRIKSGKSFASVNPEDQMIAQSRREAGRPVTRQPISNKRTRFEDETVGQLSHQTEK